MAEVIVVLDRPNGKGHKCPHCTELEIAAKRFDWEVYFAQDLSETASQNLLRALNREHDIVAVMFSPEAMDLHWRDALDLVHAWAPMAHPILFFRMADHPPAEELSRAGVFHAIGLPLRKQEIHHSLGFVWAARNPSTTRKDASGSTGFKPSTHLSAGS